MVVLGSYNEVLAQSTNPFSGTTAVGTAQTIGKIGNTVAVELKVAGPSGQKTPLQIACLFEYTEGDITNSPPALPASVNGMVHLDQAFHGIITEIRKSGRFQGHALETLLITPGDGVIPATRLLLIGLGDRTKFTPELMKQVTTVGYREASRLGVDSYSQASDLKDAGIDSPTMEVAKQMIEGLSAAYQTQRYLHQHKLSSPSPVRKLTILSGPAFFDMTRQGLTDALINVSQN
ncbi:hypothetical protein GCM10028819_24620 [Spirosoma humi]